MNSRTRSLLFLLVLALCPSAWASKATTAKAPKKAPPTAQTPVEIQLSHSFGDEAKVELQKLIQRFNDQNHGEKVVLVQQAAGGKPTMLNILRRTQVAEFAANKNAFKPLYSLMKEAREPLNFTVSPDLRAGVSDEKGRLVALPVSYSTPVLFYNKIAFRKAGLNPDQAPATWDEMQAAVIKLYESGSQCAYTTSWPTWVHIDNLSALSGVPVVNTKGDLAFNALPQIKHIAKLATWKKAGAFQVFGRRNEADHEFAKGRCAMLTSDSWVYTEFREAQGVELGVAPLPHDGDAYIKRQHTLADGPSLWVGAGFKPNEYKTAARFVTFLLAPENQIRFASTYGHLPLTEAARTSLKEQTEKDRDQTFAIAYASLASKGANNPVRISAIDPVRIILEEELERVWEDKIPPKEALDNAVTRGNAILKARPTLKKPVPL